LPAGLPVPGGTVQHFAADEESEVDRSNEPGRDIMLVIAGGEGYVDFRRGIQLVINTRTFLKTYSFVSSLSNDVLISGFYNFFF